jgi:hypothetical protein
VSRIAAMWSRLGGYIRWRATVRGWLRPSRLVGFVAALVRAGRSRFTLPPIAWTRVAVTTVKIGIVVVVTSVALGVSAFAAASFYSEYGAGRNVPNAHAWAGLTPRFAGQAICSSCHAPEAGAQDASIHVNVSCEDCHGPAAAHSSSAAAARAAVLTKPTSGTCATCHLAAAGRPAAFPQIDRAAHYSGEQCLRCHDPHSIVAVRPPTVTHPLANLPECTTCHAPDGLKKVPTGHEVVGDTICLSCHGPAANREP